MLVLFAALFPPLLDAVPHHGHQREDTRDEGNQLSCCAEGGVAQVDVIDADGFLDECN